MQGGIGSGGGGEKDSEKGMKEEKGEMEERFGGRETDGGG